MNDTLTVEASAGHIPAGPYTGQISNIDKKVHPQYGVSYNIEFTILDDKEALNDEGQKFKLRGRKVSKFFSETVTKNSFLGKLFLGVGFDLKVGSSLKIGDLLGKQLGVVIEDKSGEGKHAGKTFSNPTTFYKAEDELPEFSKSEMKIVEKTTTAVVPAKAPMSPKQFVEGVEEDSEMSVAEMEAEAAEMEAKAARARVKAAKAREGK